jgi:hypothetical protein
MKFVYVMINNTSDWEDIVIYLSEEEAVSASTTYPNIRIELFSKNPGFNGYIPTYNYYLNGKLYKSSNK